MVIHRRYNPEAITAYNIVPGLLGVILSMTLVMMTALGVTREYERGTMESLLATPARPIEVMIGKLAPYVAVGLIQTAVILVLARALFQVPMAGGWVALSLDCDEARESPFCYCCSNLSQWVGISMLFA